MLRISTKVRIADQMEEPTFGPCTRRDFGRGALVLLTATFVTFRDIAQPSTLVGRRIA